MISSDELNSLCFSFKQTLATVKRVWNKIYACKLQNQNKYYNFKELLNCRRLLQLIQDFNWKTKATVSSPSRGNNFKVGTSLVRLLELACIHVLKNNPWLVPGSISAIWRSVGIWTSGFLAALASFAGSSTFDSMLFAACFEPVCCFFFFVRLLSETNSSRWKFIPRTDELIDLAWSTGEKHKRSRIAPWPR